MAALESYTIGALHLGIVDKRHSFWLSILPTIRQAGASKSTLKQIGTDEEAGPWDRYSNNETEGLPLLDGTMYSKTKEQMCLQTTRTKIPQKAIAEAEPLFRKERTSSTYDLCILYH